MQKEKLCGTMQIVSDQPAIKVAIKPDQTKSSWIKNDQANRDQTGRRVSALAEQCSAHRPVPQLNDAKAHAGETKPSSQFQVLGNQREFSRSEVSFCQTNPSALASVL